MAMTRLYSILQTLWTSSNGSKVIIRETMLLWMIWLGKHTLNSLLQKRLKGQIGLSTQIRSQSTFVFSPSGAHSLNSARQTADTFQAAATFFELVNIWGPPDGEIQAKIKYAKWNAVRIAKALKEGKDPNESNPKPQPTEEPLPLTPQNGEDSSKPKSLQDCTMLQSKKFQKNMISLVEMLPWTPRLTILYTLFPHLPHQNLKYLLGMSSLILEDMMVMSHHSNRLKETTEAALLVVDSSPCRRSHQSLTTQRSRLHHRAT